MKKFFVLTLALVCVAGLSFGCKKADNAPATDAPAAAEAAADAVDEATAEAVEDAAEAIEDAAEAVEDAADAATDALLDVEVEAE